MNVTGKGLQAIYDTGSKRLQELEAARKSQLQDVVRQHSKQSENTQLNLRSELESSSNEVDQDLREHLVQALERLEEAANKQTEEIDQHVERVIAGLGRVSTRLSQTVDRISKGTQTQLAAREDNCRQNYAAFAESNGSIARAHAASALCDCHSRGADSHIVLLHNIDNAWKRTLDGEEKIGSALNAEFSSNSRQIENQLFNARAQLSALNSSKMEKLAASSKQAGETIRSEITYLLASSDRHTSDCHARVKESFQKVLADGISAVDESANPRLLDAQTLVHSSNADLSEHLQRFSTQGNSELSAVIDVVSGKQAQLADSAEESRVALIREMSNRVEAAELLQKQLETQRAAEVTEVSLKLTELTNRYTERLADLLQDNLQKVQAFCDEAEVAVVAAHQKCTEESKSYTADRRVDIEKRSTRFVDRLVSEKTSALCAIARASDEIAGSEDKEEHYDSEPVSENNDEVTGGQEPRRRKRKQRGSTKK